MVRLFKRMLLPLFLLAKDVNGVLELRKSCTFSIDALPSGLGALSHYLPFGINFLFLVEPFEILLNSG
jgi:hypothetical protein